MSGLGDFLVDPEAGSLASSVGDELHPWLGSWFPHKPHATATRAHAAPEDPARRDWGLMQSSINTS